MAVSQGGEPGHQPDVLIRFRAAIGNAGNITGPYRGYLYYWKTTRIEVLDRIAMLLWPYLGSEKRKQLEAASTLARRPFSLGAEPFTHELTGLLAWAAGFFDGEGSVWADDDPRTGRYRSIEMEIAQSSADGPPETLVRFGDIVGAGRITGPHEPRSPWSRLPQYRWRESGLEKVELVATLLAPWLGVVKRAQFEEAISKRKTGMRRRTRGRSRSVQRSHH